MSFVRRHPLLLVGPGRGPGRHPLRQQHHVRRLPAKDDRDADLGKISCWSICWLAAASCFFVVELRRQAIRVLLTVIVALLLGFLVTFIFNLDSAERFTRGEFPRPGDIRCRAGRE